MIVYVSGAGGVQISYSAIWSFIVFPACATPLTRMGRWPPGSENVARTPLPSCFLILSPVSSETKTDGIETSDPWSPLTLDMYTRPPSTLSATMTPTAFACCATKTLFAK